MRVHFKIGRLGLTRLTALRYILTETEVADARDELEQLGVPGTAADPSGATDKAQP